MFRAIGTLAARRPIAIVVAWVLITVAATLGAPSLGSVVSASQAAYLPASANSRQAEALVKGAFPHAAVESALVVVTGPAAGRAAAVAALSRYALHDMRPAPSRVLSDAATPDLRRSLDSRDGAATTVSIEWQTAEVDSALTGLRASIAAHHVPGVTAQVTGSAAISMDYQTQISTSTGITTVASVVLVIVILLVLFRSLVLPLVPLVTLGLAILVAMRVVAYLGQHGMIVSQNTPIFLIVLLAGAGTDYCLFLANRYKEELQNGAEPREGVVIAVTHVGASIASSGVAVMVGLAGMAFAAYGLFNTTGPAVAAGVAVTLLAGLTLTPALLALLGRYTYWPARLAVVRPSRFWGPLAAVVTRRPRTAALALVAVLVPLNLGALSTAQSFNFLTDLNRGVEARTGFETMVAHYGAGDSLPTTLVVAAPRSLRTPDGLARLDRLAVTLAALPDAERVQGPTRPDGHPLPYALYARSPRVAAALARHLSTDGRVATYTLVSASDPYGAAARQLVAAAQAAAGTAFPTARVHTGGQTAVVADTQSVVGADVTRIALFVLGGILLVLVVLLRSIVAPIYLLLTVVLSFGATLGATTLLFQGLGGEAGLTYWMPILMFTFLVGLGIDYNILLMSRVREEAARGGDYRAAVAQAVERTGGIISSCGLILAGTFGALSLASVAGLRELGFAVGAGILFDTFLIRSVLVPAIVVLVGQASWFPGGLARAARPARVPAPAGSTEGAGLAQPGTR